MAYWLARNLDHGTIWETIFHSQFKYVRKRYFLNFILRPSFLANLSIRHRNPMMIMTTYAYFEPIVFLCKNKIILFIQLNSQHISPKQCNEGHQSVRKPSPVRAAIFILQIWISQWTKKLPTCKTTTYLLWACFTHNSVILIKKTEDDHPIHWDM